MEWVINGIWFNSLDATKYLSNFDSDTEWYFNTSPKDNTVSVSQIIKPLTQQLIKQVQFLLTLLEGTQAGESEAAKEIRELIYKIEKK